MLRVLKFRWKLLFKICVAISALLLIFRTLYTNKTPMAAPPSALDVATSLLTKNGLQVDSIKVLQSLWAGYGSICHIVSSPLGSPASSGHTSRTASTQNSGVSTPIEAQSFILKLIAPPLSSKASNEGHLRKILSYRVEQYFYTRLAPLLPHSIPVAACLASINEINPDGKSTTAMILTDLRQRFPVAGEKRDVLSTTQVFAALDWLAAFHGFWWPRAKDLDRDNLVRPPLEEAQRMRSDAGGKSVWLNGGYTYLATRRSELANLAADDCSEWSTVLTKEESDGFSIAEKVAAFLSPKLDGKGPIAIYETLIHGDVKSENLFTSKDGTAVAFYDFQYVGLGLGACDLAKLFTCSIPLSMLIGSEDTGNVPRELSMQKHEKQILERYLAKLKNSSGMEYEWDVFKSHWEIALVDWLRFQSSWGFWGNTEWLEARVRWILKDEGWRNAL
jgi:hypothetical protein